MAVSLRHQNDRLPYHCTTPAWQNGGGSMPTTTGAMAPTPTSPRTPGSSVNPTCHNQQCGCVIKYLMAMGTPSAGDSAVGALQHERLHFYFPGRLSWNLIRPAGPHSFPSYSPHNHFSLQALRWATPARPSLVAKPLCWRVEGWRIGDGPANSA